MMKNNLKVVIAKLSDKQKLATASMFIRLANANNKFAQTKHDEVNLKKAKIILDSIS
jgi:hypothetical protein